MQNSVVFCERMWWAAKLMTYEKNEKTKKKTFIFDFTPILVAFVGFETPWLKKTYSHHFWTQELVGIIVGFDLFFPFLFLFQKRKNPLLMRIWKLHIWKLLVNLNSWLIIFVFEIQNTLILCVLLTLIHFVSNA